VRVWVGDRVWVGVRVTVGVLVAVGVIVSVDVGVRVTVGEEVRVEVGISVSVGMGDGVDKGKLQADNSMPRMKITHKQGWIRCMRLISRSFLLNTSQAGLSRQQKSPQLYHAVFDSG
jgi:uncharacterized protein with FMN-binding domain